MLGLVVIDHFCYMVVTRHWFYQLWRLHIQNVHARNCGRSWLSGVQKYSALRALGFALPEPVLLSSRHGPVLDDPRGHLMKVLALALALNDKVLPLREKSWLCPCQSQDFSPRPRPRCCWRSRWRWTVIVTRNSPSAWVIIIVVHTRHRCNLCPVVKYSLDNFLKAIQKWLKVSSFRWDYTSTVIPVTCL